MAAPNIIFRSTPTSGNKVDISTLTLTGDDIVIIGGTNGTGTGDINEVDLPAASAAQRLQIVNYQNSGYITMLPNGTDTINGNKHNWGNTPANGANHIRASFDSGTLTPVSFTLNADATPVGGQASNWAICSTY